MDIDIKAIVLMLTSQCMINLGEIEDPISKQKVVKPEGATVFIELLEVLHDKTQGNLTDGEERFLSGALENLKKIFHEKFHDEMGN